MKTEDTGRSKDRLLNQAKSKPNPVDRPVTTARTIVHHYNYKHTVAETVLLIFPSSKLGMLHANYLITDL